MAVDAASLPSCLKRLRLCALCVRRACGSQIDPKGSSCVADLGLEGVGPDVAELQGGGECYNGIM